MGGRCCLRCASRARCWGYFNGKTANTSATPKMTLKTRHTAGATPDRLAVIGTADRTPNADAMTANTLTGVTLPSGGEVAFAYEPHRFAPQSDTCAWIADAPILTFGGGLRVVSISVKASADAEPAVTTYAYGADENGLAECIALPHPSTFLTAREGLTTKETENSPIVQLFTCRSVDIHNESEYMLNHIGETPIWYKDVAVYYGGGKTVHQFCDMVSPNGVSNEWQENNPCHSYNDLTDLRHAFSQGVVEIARTEYERKNGAYSPLKEIRSYYSMQDRSTSTNRQIIDFSVKRTAVDRGIGLFSPDIRPDHNGHIWMSQSSHFPSPFETGHIFYHCQPYPIQFLYERIDSTVTREYTPNGVITGKMTYTYHDKHDFVAEERRYRGGELLAREVRDYAFDDTPLANGSALSRLVGANRIATPHTETTYSASGQVRHRVRTEYALFYNLALPYRVTTDCGGSQSFELKRYDYNEQHRITDLGHDNGSNCEAFVWDKAGLHPIAGVVGKTSKEADALFGEAISYDQGLGEPMWQRMAQKGADAIFATYRYKDLYGLASVTALNGVTTRYGYDDFGRLTEVAVGGKPTLANECSVGGGEAQTYINTKTFTESDASRYIYDIQHYDGLFRPVRTVTGASADTHALVSLNEYDQWGRLSRAWSAAPVNGSGYPSISEMKNAAVASYDGDACPYSEMSYLDAPTDSVAWRIGAGNAWHTNGKKKVTSTFTNQPSGALMCRKYTVSDGGLSASGVWATGSLRVVAVTDEDGRTARAFTDGEERTVLTRRDADTGTYADTYFVCDDRGMLSYVLPPEASARLEKNPKESKDIIASLCYVYEYDDLGRCVSKKLPGREPMLMRYDRGGRLCLEQDGNMREKGEWRVTLRDRYGRTAVTLRAKMEKPWTCDSILFRADYSGDGALCGYEASEAVSKIISDCEIENIYFYDSYDWQSHTGSDSLAYRDMPGYDSRYRCKVAPERSAVGLCTGKMTRVYGGKGDTLACAIYYDERGGVVQRHERNHMGGYEHRYFRLTFTGKPLEIKHVHSTADTIISDIVRYSYDNMERQLTISLDHNGTGETQLSSNAYDRLGRLAACSINGGCNVAYAYNVRGWTRNVTAGIKNATVFGQTLHYEDAPSGGAPCWSGNISGISWRQRESLKAATPTESQYLFRYDALNRLTRADYSSTGEQWIGDLLTQGDRNFTCAYAYDLNGNVTHLKRHGVNFYNTAMPTHIRSFGVIDDLAMTYSGNQLKSVTDRAEELTYAGAMDFKDGADKTDEYAYDANGNMTRDLNKGISLVTYNPLNLPERILFADGHEVRYTYASDGRKLRAEYLLSNIAIIDTDKATSGETSTFALNEAVTAPGIGELPAKPAVTTLMVRDYCGSHIYLNGKLERTLTTNGYIQDGEPYFYIKDYQGNVRAVLNQQNQVVELTAYYPYGAPMAATAAENVQPYKFGAKELDRENGLNWYDSRARFYAPLTGRTPTQDPMAEKYPHLSPYLWCAGNPISFTDPSGMYLRACDNYDGAADNLAQIAATSYGDRILNAIIENQYLTIKLKTCFFTSSSHFDSKLKEISYPETCLRTVDFTRTKSVHVMGHELKHAFDWLNGFTANSWSQRDDEEDRAVSFQNYLYDEYETGYSRNQYSGRKVGAFHQYKYTEHISDFSKIESMEGVKYGYSFNVSDIKANSKYRSAQKCYLIIRFDANKNMYFNVYYNKVDYDHAYKK